MICYYFSSSSSSSLFLFLRYIALDSCVGRARSLLNSRPGPTSSLSTLICSHENTRSAIVFYDQSFIIVIIS